MIGRFDSAHKDLLLSPEKWWPIVIELNVNCHISDFIARTTAFKYRMIYFEYYGRELQYS